MFPASCVSGALKELARLHPKTTAWVHFNLKDLAECSLDRAGTGIELKCKLTCPSPLSLPPVFPQDAEAGACSSVACSTPSDARSSLRAVQVVRNFSAPRHKMLKSPEKPQPKSFMLLSGRPRGIWSLCFSPGKRRCGSILLPELLPTESLHPWSPVHADS